MLSRLILLASFLFLYSCVEQPPAEIVDPNADESLEENNNSVVDNGPGKVEDPPEEPDEVPLPMNLPPLVLNDPLAQYAWHIKNDGQNNFAMNSGVNGIDLNLEGVYQMGYSGKGVKIAVSDDGMEIAHPDLAGNVLSGQSRNYTSSNPNNWIGDPTHTSDLGHGTAVAGILGAVGNNNIGSHGVAPHSSIAGFLFLDAPFSISRDIDQAKGDFDIFNYSYGYPNCAYTDFDESMMDQIRFGATNQRDGLGSLYVKSAGNDFVGSLTSCGGPDNPYLGNSNMEEGNSMPELIVVAANNANGFVSSYSTPGSNIWVTGPGGEFGSNDPAIMTTDFSNCTRGMSKDDTNTNSFEDGANPLNSSCNFTSTMNGTSSAAPNVSGVIALILEANPNLNWREVKHVLASTARRIDQNASATSHPYGDDLAGHTYEQGWTRNAAGFYFHNWFGFGLVDAHEAVKLAITDDAELPPLRRTNWVHNSGSLNLSVPDNSSTGVTHSINVNDSMDIEAVQIRLSVDHTYAGDLGVELTSPSGTKSIILNINSYILGSNLDDITLLSNAFYGEPSNGQWTIKIIDGAQDDSGALRRWSINLYGH
jgi:subtilisin-like proprotein convertase family protein/subtilisin family serine protease